MFTSAIKVQTSVCCSISLNPYKWYFKLGIMEEKKKKKAIILLAYIADVSCLTNRSFYMRTFSLRQQQLFLISLIVQLTVFKSKEKTIYILYTTVLYFREDLLPFLVSNNVQRKLWYAYYNKKDASISFSFLIPDNYQLKNILYCNVFPLVIFSDKRRIVVDVSFLSFFFDIHKSIIVLKNVFFYLLNFTLFLKKLLINAKKCQSWISHLLGSTLVRALFSCGVLMSRKRVH